MGSKSKTFAVFLFLIMFFSPPSLLLVKPASAQNNTIPSVSIISPVNGSTFNFPPPFNFQLVYETNSTLSWVGYSINGGGNITVSENNSTVWPLEGNNGLNTLTLYANDTFGNWASPQTVTYSVIVHAGLTQPYRPNWITVSAFAVVIAVVMLVGLLIYRQNKNAAARASQESLTEPS